MLIGIRQSEKAVSSVLKQEEPSQKLLKGTPEIIQENVPI